MIQTQASYSLFLMILACKFTGFNSSNGLEKNASYVQTLSRQRRYLIFPLGSSIQALWNQDIYISNYGQYLLTGFTVALAWELPSQPTYPEWEQMGTSNAEPESSFSLKSRKDSNSSDPDLSIQPENYTPNQKMALHNQESDFKNHVRKYYEFLVNRYQKQFYKNLHKNGHKSTDIIFPYSPEYNASKDFDAFTQYMVGNYFKPWFDSEQIRLETTIKPPDSRRSGTKMLNTVYSAMKKRYVRSASTTQEEFFYLDHHRKTRQHLYAIIEKYLSAKGLNGTACVMKAICEVNEKRNETRPGPFIAEIFRVIFSLPVPHLHHLDNKRHIEYDDANQSADCVNKYENCPGSMWDVSSGFN